MCSTYLRRAQADARLDPFFRKNVYLKAMPKHNDLVGNNCLPVVFMMQLKLDGDVLRRAKMFDGLKSTELVEILLLKLSDGRIRTVLGNVTV